MGALPGLGDVDPEEDRPGWEAVEDDGVPLDGDCPDKEAVCEVPPDVGLADGEILGEPPSDEGIEPSGDVSSCEGSPSEDSFDDASGLSSPEESAGSPPGLCSSAEGFEKTGAGVPVARDEVEEGGEDLCVAVPDEPEEVVAEILSTGEFPFEPALGAVIFELDL